MSSPEEEQSTRHFWEDAFDPSVLTVSVLDDFVGDRRHGEISYSQEAGRVVIKQTQIQLVESLVLRGKLRPLVSVEFIDHEAGVTEEISGILLGTSLSGNGMFIAEHIPSEGLPIGPLVIEHVGPDDLTFNTLKSELPQALATTAQ